MIEIGLILDGVFDEDCRRALDSVRDRLARSLSEAFPGFDWRLTAVSRDPATTGSRVEPILLLQRAAEEREGRGWDFAVLVTDRDLVAHYEPFALAAVSRALDSMVVSTARVDPRRPAHTSGAPRDAAPIAGRVEGLVLHGLGHLNGLAHDRRPGNVMAGVETPEDLDRPRAWTPEQREAMTRNLREIADLRLEEQEAVHRSWLATLYLRGAWINRHEIYDAVVKARPWDFPVRLPRLTTAALSALVILMLTAETWELAFRQSAVGAGILLAVALAVTTAFVTARQRLLVRRRRKPFSEQVAITNVSATLVVGLGMATTAALLFGVALAVAFGLYDATLLGSWASTLDGAPGGRHYLLMAAFVSAVGLIVGALGASFENVHDFQHVIFVDEEI